MFLDSRTTSPQGLLKSILRDFCGTEDVEAVLEIAGELEYLRLASGEVLFKMGERSEDIYFVLSGRLRAIVERQLSPPAVLGEIPRGETVGELSLFTGDVRGATVVAVRETLLAKMTRAVFERVVVHRPSVALAIMRTVIARFRRTEKQKQGQRAPTVLCLLAAAGDVDVGCFAKRLAAMLERYVDPVAVLDSAAVIDSAPAHLFAAREAQSRMLILVCDPGATAWNSDCVQAADEVLLLVQGDGAAPRPDVDGLLTTSDGSRSLVRQTLVVFHPADRRSPTGTGARLDHHAVSRHFHVRPDVERDMVRLARMISGHGVGLVLSGGGARGFAHIGVINALAEAGIEPDVIGGTSIGSVMGAWRAMDVRGEALAGAARRAFMEASSPTGDINIFPFISLIKGRRARELTERAVRDSVGTDIGVEDTWTTFFCVAANYSTSREAVLARGSLSKSVLASYAIPCALPPIPIDGHLHIDGAAVNNLPVDVMERFGVGTVIAVDLLSDPVRRVDVEWMPSSLELLLDRFRPRARRRYDLPSLAEILVKAGTLHSKSYQRQMRERADLCICPTMHRVGLLDWKRFDAVVASGFDATREALAALDAGQRRALLGLGGRPRSRQPALPEDSHSGPG